MPEQPSRELDAEAIFAVLSRHQVRYVVIGGMAGILHGSGLSTLDVDITPAADNENLQRLVKALEELDAKLRVPDGTAVAFPFDAHFLGQLSIATLDTRLGDLDICFRPTAPGRDQTFSYEDLVEDAITIELDESVQVASLDDVIASKEASGRVKDLSTLPVLYRLRELLREDEAPEATDGGSV